MRPVALWYDCNTLLDVVPEQHLQKKNNPPQLFNSNLLMQEGPVLF